MNPSLWRQAKLNGIHGLFEVVPGIYQVRGYDISNMTLIDGRTGWIVVDPLDSRETAAAALALARRHLGEKPVVAVIFTHSHVDHFGGVDGVLPDEATRARSAHHRAARLHRGGDQRERPRRRRHGPARELHVRHAARARPARPRRHRPRQGAARAAHRHRRADRHGRPHAAGDGDRRRALRLPVRAGVGGARRADLLPAGREGLLRRRDRDRTRCTTSTRCAAPRCATRSRWSGYIDEATRLLRRRRGGLREPPLAGLGQRARRRLPEEAARHVPLHPRPDAAPGERRARRRGRSPRSSSCRRRCARSSRAAATTAPCATTRRPSTRATSAGTTATPRTSIRCRPSRRAKVRRGDGRRGRGAAARTRGVRPRRLSLGRDAAQPRRLRRARRTPRRASCWRATYDQLGYQAESGPWRDVYLTGALELRHGVQGCRARSARRAPGLLRTCPLDRFFDVDGGAPERSEGRRQGHDDQLRLHRPRRDLRPRARERRPAPPRAPSPIRGGRHRAS